MPRSLIVWSCLAATLTLTACGDDDTESSEPTSNTSNTAGATSNSTGATSNGTGDTSNATGDTSNTTTGTTGGATTAGPSDMERCLAVCAAQAACPELTTACGEPFAVGYADSCAGRCDDEAQRGDFVAREGLACSTLIPALILEPGFTDDCDPELLDDGTPDPIVPVRTEIGMCEEFTVCGGDPVGSWTIDQLCLEFSEAPGEEEEGDDVIPECEGDALGFEINGITGSMEIRDDQSYTQTITYSAGLVITVPIQGCLMDVLNTNCTTYGTFINQAPDSLGWTCAEEGDTCTCTTPNGFSSDETNSGSWTRQGDQISIIQENPPPEPGGGILAFEICGEDDSLDLAFGMPGGEFYYHLEMTRASE